MSEGVASAAQSAKEALTGVQERVSVRVYPGST